jgi:hypothetical protein
MTFPPPIGDQFVQQGRHGVRKLRQTRQECAARAELRGKDAEPLAGADL